MTSFLLIISFIIDGIILYGLFILSTRIKRAEEIELRQKEIASEIEGMFTSYLMEIKEENKRLENQLSDHQVEEKEETKVFSTNEETRYQPPLPKEEEVFYEKSLNTQVMELKNKGYSINQIAKALNKGQTEIELLIKFQQEK